jgi:hypothetical protein
MPKVGSARFNQFARCGDGVVARFGVTWPIAEEQTIGLEPAHFGGRCLRRHHGNAATAAGQHAQDVALDAKVIGHHVVAWRGQGAEAGAQLPFGFSPLVGFGHGDFTRQVQPGHRRCSLSPRHRLADVIRPHGVARFKG